MSCTRSPIRANAVGEVLNSRPHRHLSWGNQAGWLWVDPTDIVRQTKVMVRSRLNLIDPPSRGYIPASSVNSCRLAVRGNRSLRFQTLSHASGLLLNGADGLFRPGVRGCRRKLHERRVLEPGWGSTLTRTLP
jgi:hypothetical protein